MQHAGNYPGRIGFMQGRLSPPVGGRTQAFPAGHWREEFAIAELLSLPLMEWVLDHDGAGENPLMTQAGRAELHRLSVAHRLAIPALTGDLFMQQPFWKAGATRGALVRLLDDVLDACTSAGIATIVVPLVDNGSLENDGHCRVLKEVLLPRASRLVRARLTIAFESDKAPRALAAFIADYPADAFGITYDTGNSAASGYDWRQELAAYGARVVHVHIKDRLLHGGTVPLGQGSADLTGVLAGLERRGYRGNYVLQTARAGDGDHQGALGAYRAMALNWLAGGR
jgi:L-ribulose-5-phosphate 3-epimerase